jgi:hypothetical protein
LGTAGVVELGFVELVDGKFVVRYITCDGVSGHKANPPRRRGSGRRQKNVAIVSGNAVSNTVPPSKIDASIPQRCELSDQSQATCSARRASTLT